MRSFAIFVGLILLGFAGLALLGYPAWLLVAQFPGDDPKFSRVASRVGMLILLLGFIFVARRLKVADRQSLGYGPLRISVNLSPVQFLRQDIVQLVEATLEATNLNPEFLELELTEGSLLKDVERTKEVLRRLKNLGVRIAIDDFGVGFSSLSYLKNFTVDTLKIDRSFISSLLAESRDEAIVRARYALGSFVIEGVSTTLPFLSELVEDDAFMAGDLDTHLVERFLAGRKSA